MSLIYYQSILGSFCNLKLAAIYSSLTFLFINIFLYGRICMHLTASRTFKTIKITFCRTMGNIDRGFKKKYRVILLKLSKGICKIENSISKQNRWAVEVSKWDRILKIINCYVCCMLCFTRVLNCATLRIGTTKYCVTTIF